MLVDVVSVRALALAGKRGGARSLPESSGGQLPFFFLSNGYVSGFLKYFVTVVCQVIDIQLPTVDPLARVSMKTVAKRDRVL